MSATLATSGRSSRLKLEDDFHSSPFCYRRATRTLNQGPLSFSLAQMVALILPRRISCAGFVVGSVSAVGSGFSVFGMVVPPWLVGLASCVLRAPPAGR